LISPGWSAGLALEGAAASWRELDRPADGSRGLVSILIAREHRYGNLAVCGYLVDVFCLGVKDTIGPRTFAPDELRVFTPGYFGAYAEPPLRVPIELARSLVLGAVEYARGLGFEPHADFARARPLLGETAGPSPIGFGDRGRPHFISGPRDDVERIVATLRSSVGDGRFGCTILG